MKKLKSLFYFYFLFVINSSIHGQVNPVDSLKLILKNAKHDTLRCRALAGLTEIAPDGEWEAFNAQLAEIAEQNLKRYNSSDPFAKVFKKYLGLSFINSGIIVKTQGKVDEALVYFKNSLKIQEEINNKEGIAYAQGAIGVIYQDLGKNQEALSYHLKAAQTQKEVNDLRGLGYTLIYIGQVYNDEGNIMKAMEYYSMSLKINEKIDNKQGIAFATNDLGVLYKSQNQLNEALQSYTKSYQLQGEMGDKLGQAISLNNVGDVYRAKGDLSKALEYFQKSLASSIEIDNKHGIGRALGNIGLTYETLHNLDSAKMYYEKCLGIYEEIKESEGIATINTSLGRIYFSLGKNQNAIDYALKGFDLAKQLGYPTQISNSANLLKDIYKKQNQPGKALAMFELYLLMRDSIDNQQNKKASIRNQLKYDFEKKAAEESIRVANEKKLSDLKFEQEQKQRYFLYGGLVLTVVFGGFMFNRFRITPKQKKVIEAQKQLVDEKQKEIIDSIHYAKRIQQSLMPNEKFIKKMMDKLKK